MLGRLHVQRPYSNMDLRLIRYDVDCSAAFRHTAGERCHRCRIHLPGDKEIDRLVDLVHDHQRIHTELRLGAVSPLTFNLYDKGIQGSRIDSHRVAHRLRLFCRLHMDAERRVHLRILQQSVADHHARPRSGLLSGLEHQLDSSRNAVLHPLQDMRRAQQHRRMAVMAAHVAFSIAGSEFQVILLLDGEGVHISPQKDAGTSVSDDRCHSGGILHPRESRLHKIFGHLLRHLSSAFLPRYPHLIQPLLNISAGLRQIHADLRDLMEVSPILHDLSPDLIRHVPYLI